MEKCNRQNNVPHLPKDVHFPIPRTYKYVTLHGRSGLSLLDS
jgi:hypothetical protein